MNSELWLSCTQFHSIQEEAAGEVEKQLSETCHLVSKQGLRLNMDCPHAYHPHLPRSLVGLSNCKKGQVHVVSIESGNLFLMLKF